MESDHKLVTDDEASGLRLDVWLARRLPSLSRARLQALIAEGHVLVDGATSRAVEPPPPRAVGGGARARAVPGHPPARGHPPLGRPRGRAPPRRRQAGGARGSPGRGNRRRDPRERPPAPRARPLRDRRGPPSRHRPPPRPGHLRASRGGQGRRDPPGAGAPVLLAPGREGVPGPRPRRAPVEDGRDRPAPSAATRSTGRRCRSTPPGAARRAPRGRGEESFDGACLLRVRIHTGRTHQIRVHLASIGHPVAGDDTYGGTRTPSSRRAEARDALRSLDPPGPARRAARLHASRTRGERSSSSAPLPADLATVLDRLRKAAQS